MVDLQVYENDSNFSWNYSHGFGCDMGHKGCPKGNRETRLV